jgi:hypothetical protein
MKINITSEKRNKNLVEKKSSRSRQNVTSEKVFRKKNVSEE